MGVHVNVSFERGTEVLFQENQIYMPHVPQKRMVLYIEMATS